MNYSDNEIAQIVREFRDLQTKVNTLEREGTNRLVSLEREGTKIAKNLTARVERLESAPRCPAVTETRDAVEKFNWVFKDIDGDFVITDEKYANEDEFYEEFPSDDYTVVQKVEGSGEYL